jgi:hypothetical protein
MLNLTMLCGINDKKDENVLWLNRKNMKFP